MDPNEILLNNQAKNIRGGPQGLIFSAHVTASIHA
jgi:hypothetical protein